MIVKARKVPRSIQMMEALLRRLPANHNKRAQIEENLGKAWAGYHGEVKIDKELELLPEKEFYIFHDLRLLNGDKAFQIDTFVLTPFVGVIIETKNISGTLTFDRHFEQMIRTHDNKEEGFLHPLAQVRKQQMHLKNLLEAHKLKPFPIDYLVAISKPTTILKTSREDRDLTEKVLHSALLPERIKQLTQKYPERVLSSYLMEKVSQLLLREHTPLHPHIREQFKIPATDTMKGVQCPSCQFLPMSRKRATWHCPTCQTDYKTAHEQAIHDYLLLINPTINNEQCRQFLLLSSRDTAYRLLTSMNLPYSGSGKGRVYYLPEYE